MSTQLPAQTQALDEQTFFNEQGVLDVNLTTDIKKLRGSKDKPVWLPASVTMHFSETDSLKSAITVRMRGNMRRSICDIATLELNFSGISNVNISNLKKLKLVGGCRSSSFDEELLVKEFLIYKMYNQLTPLSFRVRMLKVHYQDSRNKVNSYTQMAFLIEDADALAKRNGMKQKKYGFFKTENTDRLHTTFVSIFEYMIANTDWSITARHNVKLFVPINDTTANPVVVPYDFDYSGIINAPYAVPSETLGITTVRVRLYRGYPRIEEELVQLIEPFKRHKDEVTDVIKDCKLLDNRSKKDMLGYIKSFYDIINKESSIRRVFIQNARID